MSGLALVEQLANGAVIGVFYALTALGLSMIFGVLRVVNFAHGELYMLGGYAYYLLAAASGTPPVLAIAGAALAVFVLGVIIERLLVEPIYGGKVDRPDEYAIMITFALAVFLQNLALALFGPWPQRPAPLFRGRVEIGELIISGDRLAAAGLGLVLIVALLAFIRWSAPGKAIRAVAMDRETAEVLGIHAERTSRLAFGLGASLAGAAGALIGPVFTVTPTMGVIPVVKAYIVVVLGGLGSIPGAILGALILGEVETLATVLIPDTSRALAYKDAYGLLVLVLVLLLRPQGLFGMRERRA